MAPLAPLDDRVTDRVGRSSPDHLLQSVGNYLPVLAADIKAAHEAVGLHARSMAEHALEAGHLLIEAKDNLKHGEFGPWLKDHVGMSERSARRYMALARSGVNSAIVAELGIVGAIDHHANVLNVPLPNAGECIFGTDGAKRYLFVWHEPKHSNAEFVLVYYLDFTGDNGGFIDGTYRGISRDHIHAALMRSRTIAFDYGPAEYERLPYAAHAEFLEGLRQSFWQDEVASWRSGGAA